MHMEELIKEFKKKMYLEGKSQKTIDKSELLWYNFN